MADLRRLVEDLGYGNVRTLLNSGNIVFTTPRAAALTAAARIEKAISRELSVSARVTVISATELAAAIAENPLLDIADDDSRLLVAVLNDPLDRSKLKPLMNEDWAAEVLAIGTRVAYLWCAEGILASRLLKTIGRILGDAVTTRNWSTLKKLYALTEVRN
jgi:uncharacterized protein (DUF1697 family)